MSIQFTDYSMKVNAALDEAAIAFLEEASATLERQAANNTRVGTGETAGAWDHVVDDSKLEATIGNPLENAIWEEFGTGEFALKGNGRKGGWMYRDEKTGKFHHTFGKTPTRALHNAFTTKKTAIINRAEAILKERLNA